VIKLNVGVILFKYHIRLRTQKKQGYINFIDIDTCIWIASILPSVRIKIQK